MAITPVFCCGFECGLTNTHWLLSSATFTTSSPLSGARSLLCNGQQTAATVLDYGAGLYVIRFRIRFDTLPTFTNSICISVFTLAGAYFNATDGKIYAGTDSVTFGATGVSVSAGIIYYIDLRIDTTVNPRLVDVSVNGTACGQASASVAAQTSAQKMRLGFSTVGPIGTFDDFVLSTTSADYPIGDGKVLSFVPNADGTHTCTTTTIVKGTAATPVGANVAGNTDAFNWVNARPIGGGATDATRLINQQTAGATLYAEVQFEDTVEVNPPRAVEVLVVDQQATTAVGDMHIKLNDNGTENVILDRTAVAGVITDRFTTKQYATMVGGGTWTLARFNGLRARFGYSSDATPDQYWRGIMIEAEFPASMDASAFGRPEGQIGQSQMKQLLAQ
jgi:hypothetical protein